MPAIQSRLAAIWENLPSAAFVAFQLRKRLAHNKGILTLIGTGLVGLALITLREMRSINTTAYRNKVQADKEAKEAKAAGITVKDAAQAKKWNAPASVAVNSTFIRRLLYILKIIIPGPLSKEFFIIVTQTFMLIARTLLSIRMAQLGGDGISAVMERSWKLFAVSLCDFGFSGVLAAIVNSALKYLSNLLSIYCRQRLTRHVHEAYLKNRNYYKAAVLAHALALKAAREQEEAQAKAKLEGKESTATGTESKDVKIQMDSPDKSKRAPGANAAAMLSNADARVTQDLNEFCNVFADIYSRTFKPVLDMVVCTYQLSQSLGYAGPMTLYSYYILIGYALRMVMPPFPKLLSQQAELESNFRRSHNRLISHAEEVAFLNGGLREKEILNEELDRVTEHNQATFFAYFRQGILDQFTMKYLASIVGWPVLAVPFLLSPSEGVNNTAVVSRYRQNDALIQQSCSALHDLVMVYKKVQRLAGFTSRVSELLEGMNEINVATKRDTAAPAGKEGVKSRGNVTLVPAPDSDPESIEFINVSVATPEGRLLVKDFNLKLHMHESILVSGPNGAGKTSIFRTLAGLWPLAGGSIIKHYHTSKDEKKLSPIQDQDEDISEIFYVPQNPYLVSGTLLEQVVYPLNERQARIFHLNREAARASEAQQRGETYERVSFEDKVIECVRLVGLSRFVIPPGMDKPVAAMLRTRHHDWADVLSGGEKQRLGLSRLFFHTPRFAVLDESTSAMNVDDEGPIYERILKEGITVFSIAHRLQLRKYHKYELRLEGDGTGAWTVTRIDAASPKHDA